MPCERTVHSSATGRDVVTPSTHWSISCRHVGPDSPSSDSHGGPRRTTVHEVPSPSNQPDQTVDLPAAGARLEDPARPINRRRPISTARPHRYEAARGRPHTVGRPFLRGPECAGSRRRDGAVVPDSRPGPALDRRAPRQGGGRGDPAARARNRRGGRRARHVDREHASTSEHRASSRAKFTHWTNPYAQQPTQRSFGA